MTYRKIEVRTWSDEKFLAMSPMAPSGQGLWLYLLTNPHAGSLPGAFRASRLYMAEDLGWSQDAFDEAFAEVSAQGMAKADFAARMVLIPNACKYNQPANPNVVKMWGKAFDDLPDCELKSEAYDRIKACIHDMSKPYQEAFAKAFAKPSAKTSTKPFAKASGEPLGKASPIHNIAEHSSRTSNQEVESNTDRVVLIPHTRGRDLDHNGGGHA